jgi:hypothetical protein
LSRTVLVTTSGSLREIARVAAPTAWSTASAGGRSARYRRGDCLMRPASAPMLGSILSP